MVRNRKSKGRKLPGPFTAFPDTSEQTLAEFARLHHLSVEELRQQPFGFRLVKGLDTQAVTDVAPPNHVDSNITSAGSSGAGRLEPQELADLPYLLPFELAQQNKTRHLTYGNPFCIRDFMEESLKTIPLDHTDPNLLQEKLKRVQQGNRNRQPQSSQGTLFPPSGHDAEWHTGLTSSSSDDSDMEAAEEQRRLLPSAAGRREEEEDGKWSIDVPEEKGRNSQSKKAKKASIAVDDAQASLLAPPGGAGSYVEPFTFGLRCFPSLHAGEHLAMGRSNGEERSSPLHQPLMPGGSTTGRSGGSGVSGSADHFLSTPASPLLSGVDVTLPFHHRRVETHRRRVQVAVEKEIDRRLGVAPAAVNNETDGGSGGTGSTGAARSGMAPPSELERLKLSLEQELNNHPTLLSMGRTFAMLEDGDQPQEPRMRRKGGHRANPGPVDFLLRANLHKAFLSKEEEQEWIRQHLVSQPPRAWHQSSAHRRDSNSRSLAAAPGERLANPDQAAPASQVGPQGEVEHVVHPDILDYFVIEVTVLDGRSIRNCKEIWEFLPDQPLSTLGDVLSCSTALLPFPRTFDNFYFIGDTFFVDDRHADWKDLSLPIRAATTAVSSNRQSTSEASRTLLPGVDGVELEKPFSRCRVASSRTTTFADLSVKLGKLYCYRHYDDCDHLFYISNVRRRIHPKSHSEFPRRCHGTAPDVSMPTAEIFQAHVERHTQQFQAEALQGLLSPSRVEKVRRYPYLVRGITDRPLLCEACKTLPSTVASYFDRLTPANPTAFCKGCYRTLHSDSEGNIVLDGSVMYELPVGNYLTA